MPLDHSSAAYMARYEMRKLYAEHGTKPCGDCPHRAGDLCKKYNEPLVQLSDWNTTLWPVLYCVLAEK